MVPKPSKEYEVTVYNEFASDFAAVSPEAKEQMDNVLSRLQKNPYDPYPSVPISMRHLPRP